MPAYFCVLSNQWQALYISRFFVSSHKKQHIMSTPRKIELLAPAKDYETGIAAIDNGADAVYIGATQFGARQAAGNSVEDIARLVKYAHIFGVKVYVTLNTIIYDEETATVERLVDELYKAGVDALIVQDFGLSGMNIPPIPLHASTQMDNRTIEKVQFLSNTGFPRVVLARELTLEEIRSIHTSVPEIEIEAFVHGALCVSYSGQCYASQHCYGRSANRGACAQFCRLAFDLVDSEGKIIERNRHLLSLKDMNRANHLEEMLDAGVVSFKIEGRLKDASYVKNITAYYRAKLDSIFARRKEYTRASIGNVQPQFTPAPEKSFNRGFTTYMLHGSKEEMTSFESPKSKGELIGRVKFVSRNYFTVTGGDFNNGDGACFVGRDGKLQGFRINRVEGNRVYPQTMPPVESGDVLYRNYDCEFERQLSRPDSPRRIPIALRLSESPFGFCLEATDESGLHCSIEFPLAKDVARTPQRNNISNQLSKWGNTPFIAQKIDIEMSQEWFIPSSQLAEMRRASCESLINERLSAVERKDMRLRNEKIKFPAKSLDYRGNVSNRYAKEFFAARGTEITEPAFEINGKEQATLMFCKHCLKYSKGWCTKSGEASPFKEPFYLVSGDGRRFKLLFDCKECVMKVVAE